MPELVPPHVRYHASFVAAMREEPGAATYLFTGQESTLADPALFAAYLAALRDDAREETRRPAEYVPATTLWWVDGEDVLGRVAIRHRLNDRLRRVGGHIGYWIRPSARRQGHATAAFGAGLAHAHRLGIDPALVTCDQDNVGSRRVIERAGGVFDRRLGAELLYWVPTGRPAASDGAADGTPGG